MVNVFKIQPSNLSVYTKIEIVSQQNKQYINNIYLIKLDVINLE